VATADWGQSHEVWELSRARALLVLHHPHSGKQGRNARAVIRKVTEMQFATAAVMFELGFGDRHHADMRTVAAGFCSRLNSMADPLSRS
jgi:hypothetical protein